MQKINSFNIFKIFFKIGLILLGGGYVIVPIMQQELVEKRNWINKDELTDFYCIAQSLPGIVAINTTILVCLKTYKIKGVLSGLFGIILSPIITIILIANIIENISKIEFIQSIFYSINLCVIILIYLTLKDMWKNSIADIFTIFWFILILLLAILKINVGLLVIFSILFAIFLVNIKGKNND